MSRDRIREITFSTGLGAYVMGGAVAAHEPFSEGFANGEEVKCYIATDNVGAWEAGMGTYNAGTLTRGTLIGSSSDAFIDWDAGAKEIFYSEVASQLAPLMNGTPGNITGNATGIEFTCLGPVSANAAGATMTFRAARGGTTSGDAGDIDMVGTAATSGRGTDFHRTAGNGGGTNQPGGSFSDIGGNATGSGQAGGHTRTGGSSPTGLGGHIVDRTGPRGSIDLGSGDTTTGASGTARYGSGNASAAGAGTGKVTVSSGSPGSGGVAGSVDIQCGLLSKLEIFATGVWKVAGVTPSDGQTIIFTGGVAGLGSSGTGGSGAVYVATIAAMKALDVSGMSNGQLVVAEGYYSGSTVGGGIFIYKSGSSSTEDGGLVVQPTVGAGRFHRIPRIQGEFYITDFGAKSDGALVATLWTGTANDTFIANCQAACKAYKPSATTIGKIIVPGGQFVYDDGIAYHYNDCQWVMQSRSSRLIHRGGNALKKPGVYIYGGNSTAAIPYGGLQGLFKSGGPYTYPACIYTDAMVDNQMFLEDVNCQGTPTGSEGGGLNATTFDGVSIFGHLNCSFGKLRGDQIGGYLLRERAWSCKATPALSSGGTFKVAPAGCNLTTGVFTFLQAEAIKQKGSAVLLFYGSGCTLPTDPVSGVAMLDGPSGGVFFYYPLSETTCTLHRNRADALTGNSPIIPTVASTLAGAFTGFGMSIFPATFQVAGVSTVTGSWTYTNDKNILIPSSTKESETGSNSKTYTYGNGYTGSGTITSGGASPNGANGVVFLATTGTLPGGFVAGRAYYGYYIDAEHCGLCDTIADVYAGNVIIPTDAGTGTHYMFYDHQRSMLGVAGLHVHEFTWDNQQTPVQETVGVTQTGSMGFYFGDYSESTAVGSLHFGVGHRVEINMQPAIDRINNWTDIATLFRVEIGSRGRAEGPSVQLTIEGVGCELSVGQGNMVKLVGNRGPGDLSPNFTDIRFSQVGLGYNNDSGTAKSATMPVATSARSVLSRIEGDHQAQSTVGRVQGVVQSAISGRQISNFKLSELNNSVFKQYDIGLSLDSDVAFYIALQNIVGWCMKDGTTNALDGSQTVDGTAGSYDFVMSASPGGAGNFGVGRAVSIPLAGGTLGVPATLNCVISSFNVLTTPKTFRVSDENGVPAICVNSMAGQVMTVRGAILGVVPAFHRISRSIDFAAINAWEISETDGSGNRATIDAPSGVTLTRAVLLPAAISGVANVRITYDIYVDTAVNKAVVRAINPTGTNSSNPSARTFHALAFGTIT